jgi:hypothetical protein
MVEDRPAVRVPAAVWAAVARLAEAAADLPAGPPGRPGFASSDEEVCHRLIDLAAAGAWLRTTGCAADDVDEVLHGCVHWTVEKDVIGTRAETGSLAAGPVRQQRTVYDAHRQVTALITALADPACYDEVRARLRRVLGRRPQTRAAAAWDIADQALNGLAAVRDEWVGADPACTAAGGWVLVDRIGRLHLIAALLADIAGRPPQDRPHIVNAARRYAWNWLRLPPPEAATQSHLRRTAELMDWIREIAP